MPWFCKSTRYVVELKVDQKQLYVFKMGQFLNFLAQHIKNRYVSLDTKFEKDPSKGSETIKLNDRKNCFTGPFHN